MQSVLISALLLLLSYTTASTPANNHTSSINPIALSKCGAAVAKFFQLDISVGNVTQLLTEDDSYGFLSPECMRSMQTEINPSTLFTCAAQAMSKKRYMHIMHRNASLLLDSDKQWMEGCLRAEPVNGRFDHVDVEMAQRMAGCVVGLELEMLNLAVAELFISFYRT